MIEYFSKKIKNEDEKNRITVRWKTYWFKLIRRMFRKYLRTERNQFNTNIAAIWELRVWAMASDQFAAELLLLSLSDSTWLTVFNKAGY